MISVIILAYNGEKYIRKCLDSVVHQTIGMEQIEVIVVDDASTDTTVEIIKEYESQYPENICLITREVNSQKVGEVNRNIAMEYVSSEYILFLDQDDWYEPDAFEILMQLAKENPDLDYIEYGFHYTDIDGNLYKEKYGGKQGFNVYEIKNESVRNEYARAGILPGATFAWSKMYRKDFLIENSIYHNDGEKKTGFSDNYFSGLLVMYCKKIGKLDTPLYNYRNYVGSYSHNEKQNEKVQFERCKAGIVLYDECQRRGLMERNCEMVEYIFARIFLLKTFWKFLLQMNPISYDILAFMQQEVRKRCPRYKENSIMRDRMEMQLVFAAMDADWTPEFLDILRQQMEKLKKEKGLGSYMYF